jgi:hypothetical protein
MLEALLDLPTKYCAQIVLCDSGKMAEMDNLARMAEMDNLTGMANLRE